jgi:hypothetical protein
LEQDAFGIEDLHSVWRAFLADEKSAIGQNEQMLGIGEISPVMDGIKMPVRCKLKFCEAVLAQNPEATLGVIRGSTWTGEIRQGLDVEELFL